MRLVECENCQQIDLAGVFLNKGCTAVTTTSPSGTTSDLLGLRIDGEVVLNGGANVAADWLAGCFYCRKLRR